jgi:hypothetical protein
MTRTMSGAARVGVEVGGTFTDLFAIVGDRIRIG